MRSNPEGLALRRALENLVRAASAAIAIPTDENKAATMLYAAMAIIHMSRADPSGRAKDIAISTVLRVKEEMLDGG